MRPEGPKHGWLLGKGHRDASPTVRMSGEGSC